MIMDSYKFFSLLVVWIQNWSNIILRQFLDEDDIKGWLCLKDSVNNEVVLVNVLRKYVNFL